GPARVGEAARLLAAAFGGGDEPVTLTRRLEAALGAGRDAWPLAAVRGLWDTLWPLEAARARSPEHEARWLNLAGFLLRPGFGDAGDELRVNRLWRVLGAELRHPRAVQCRAEWWNLWKRIAGGLAARQQEHLLQQVSPALLRRGKPRGPRPGAQELREMWQAVGSCERLPAAARAELGAVLVAEAERGRATEPELWALARLGARAPLYGPLNCVVARDTAAAWAERLLGAAWPRPEAYAFALAQIARATGGRPRRPWWWRPRHRWSSCRGRPSITRRPCPTTTSTTAGSTTRSTTTTGSTPRASTGRGASSRSSACRARSSPCRWATTTCARST